jgi:hypothetical protein
VRWSVALAIAGSLACTAAARQDDGHLTLSSPTSHGATSAASILTGMDSTAAKLEAMNATGSRTTEHDVTWPLTPAEQKALGGWTIVLVSAVAADPSELPVTRAYLHLQGSDVVLRPLAVRRVTLDPNSRLAQRVGLYRADSFYLAPISALLKAGDMRVDFAAHRTGFILGELPLEAPDFVTAAARARLREPQTDAVATMLQREYVGFDGLTLLQGGSPPLP